jgi:hypothetical protein
MKITRLLVLGAAVLVFGGIAVTFCGPALADTVDPAIGVKGCTGGCSTGWSRDTGASFTIAPGITEGAFGGNGVCADTSCNFIDFTSNGFFITDGGTISSFLYDFLGVAQPGGFSVTADSAFQTLQSNGDNTAAVLSGGTVFPPPCTSCGFSALAFAPASTDITGDFQFEMNHVANGTKVDVSSDRPLPAPEPGTLILLGSGLGLLGLRRLRTSTKTAASA